MNFIKPSRLKKGDTVAIVSPSWGGPSCFPLIYESGINELKKMGLKIKEYPTARADANLTYNNPKMRAKDINDAFADKEVKAIIATIGGDESIRILPYLNPKIIKKNPKILIGYSDTTTLTTYCNQLGLVTLNGPSIMAGFSQIRSLPLEFKNHLINFLFHPSINMKYAPYKEYHNGYLDWSKKENVGKVMPGIKTKGWKVLQGKGKVRGQLFGGCFEVMEFMKGTKYWPKESFWKNKILFLETSEDKPTPTQVKWFLRNYGVQGIFKKINGLIIARARDYSDKENDELYKHILDVVCKEFNYPNLPILVNFDFGHSDPQYIMPLGIKAEIDCDKISFKLIESPLK